MIISPLVNRYVLAVERFRAWADFASHPLDHGTARLRRFERRRLMSHREHHDLSIDCNSYDAAGCNSLDEKGKKDERRKFPEKSGRLGSNFARHPASLGVSILSKRGK